MSASFETAEKIINDESLAEERLLDELENMEIPSSIRDARLHQFKVMTTDLREMKQKDHGHYNEILEERKFLEITTSEERCIIHFFHEDFRRCQIVDDHLEILSKRHFETRFGRINVKNAKFCVLRLQVIILPTILCFINGVVVDRIVGFDELGNTDSFETSILETRLHKSGVLRKSFEITFAKNTKIRNSNKNEGSDDDD